jgi:kanamycin kinase
LIPEGKVKAWERMKKLQHLAHDDVVIHGDYCLPNIILKDYKLQGFVDLGYGGVGDRHWDLFWGIWTLKYNLKTDKYKNIFLDAYGRNEIDSERMELSRIIAGLTG